MKVNRRRVLQFAAAVATTGRATTANASESTPASRTLRVIVSSAPGTPPDSVGRLVAERWQAATAEPVIAENYPGAIGTIGLRLLANAPPDGRVIGVFSTPYLVAPSLLTSMPLDIERDLVPIALVATGSPLLVVPTSSTARSVQELLAGARAAPGSLFYASGGNGTPSHIASALLVQAAAVEATHVPYQGATTVVAVVSGQVGMYLGPASTLAPLIEAGKLRLLATAAPQRMTSYPNTPTLVELGYRGVQFTDWIGLVAPSATATATVGDLARVVETALHNSSVKKRLESMGLAPSEMDASAFTAFFHAEYARWNRLVRVAGIKAG